MNATKTSETTARSPSGHRPAGDSTERGPVKPAGSSGISKSLLNFWLDVLLLLLFLTLFWTTAVLRFVFPPGPSAGEWTLWGFGYAQWCDLQFAVLCTLAFAILLHVMLHWSWVCGIVAARLLPRRDGRKATLDDGTRTIYGVVFLVGLLTVLGAGLAAATLSVQSPF